ILPTPLPNPFKSTETGEILPESLPNRFGPAEAGVFLPVITGLSGKKVAKRPKSFFSVSHFAKNCSRIFFGCRKNRK
ncbi:MAG: hypothetical protein II763_01290, partial [Bacteroidales bacterium]|nr:hypothetical protein [Bacteroidales bacterium]